MRFVFIGDIVGRAGRQAVTRVVPQLRETYSPDLIIANLENVAGGVGLNEKAFEVLREAGIDFFTSGNHIWDKREGVAMLNLHRNLIRPANYPARGHGVGHRVIEVEKTPVAIFNIQGRVFMPPIDCPFRAIDRMLEDVGDEVKIRIVDMHAEATSEKKAMGWYLDGRVSMLLGTHTHVPTRDAEILPKGTGFVTDVGMTGSYNSVLGMTKETAIQRFLEGRPIRFEVARGDLRSDCVVFDVEEDTGKAKNVEHIQIRAEDE